MDVCWNCAAAVLCEREYLEFGQEDDPWHRPVCWRCLLEWGQITPEEAADIQAVLLADLQSLEVELRGAA